MRLKIRKIIRQIRAGQFGRGPVVEPLPHAVVDPGHRRRAHAPMCVR